MFLLTRGLLFFILCLELDHRLPVFSNGFFLCFVVINYNSDLPYINACHVLKHFPEIFLSLMVISIPLIS